MGSLSNLFISESYQSLLHFGNNSSATATLVEIEDGVGNGLGLSLNTNGDASLDGNLLIGGDFIVSGAFDIEGKVTINDNVRVNGNLEVSGSTTLTGSLVVSNQITASNGFIINDLNVGGTLFANKVVTLIESASVIFSSGSNILGDDISDIQTLNGLVIMSGSSVLSGSMSITGDLNVGGTGTFQGNLNATGNISSSTISGIGNAFLFSQSVDARLDIVEATASLFVPFSQSVDSRLDFLEGPFSSSVNTSIILLNQFTASVGLVTTQSFQAFTASTNQRLNSIEFATSSLQTFTSSANIKFSNLESTTASLNTSVTNLNIATASLNSFSASTIISITNLQSTTASLNTSISNLNIATASLNSKTGSYATTGSNTFTGNQTITGNSVFSGSVRGGVIPLSIVSATASIDLSLGNFFTLTLASAATTRLVATNIQPGQTLILKVLQPATTGSLTYPSNIKFGNALAYSASAAANATDIITFVTYDTTNLFAASTKNLV